MGNRAARILTLIWLAALSWGCSRRVDFPVTFALDPDFTYAETIMIGEAAHRWQRSVSFVDIRFTGYTADPRVPMIYRSNHENRNAPGTAAGECSRDIFDQPNDIHIFPDNIYPYENPSSIFIASVMHEMGHFMGLYHATGGLMTPVIGKPCLIQSDIDQFCAMYECSIIAKECEP